MVTQAKMKAQANKLADYYDYLQQQTFYILIDTLKTTQQTLRNADKETILEWRLEALSKIGGLTKQVIAFISRQTGKTEQQIYDIIQKNGIKVAKQTNKQLSKALKKPLKDVSVNTLSVINSYAKQTFKNIDNYVNQSLLTTNYGKNGAARVYQDIVDKTVLDVVTGLKTPERALKDNIYKWRDKGIKTVLVDKGGHNWSLDSYTRMVMDTTTSRVFNEARMQSMKEYDTVLAVMSSHPAARPACAPIQGKVVCIVPDTDSRYEKGYPSIYDYGYGEPAGTQGINCSHMLFPYVKGISHNYQPQFDPKEAVKNAEVQQKQRYFERQIRAYKRKKELAVRLDDQEQIKAMNSKIRAYQAKTREIVRNNKFLARQYNREQIN